MFEEISFDNQRDTMGGRGGGGGVKTPNYDSARSTKATTVWEAIILDPTMLAKPWINNCI